MKNRPNLCPLCLFLLVAGCGGTVDHYSDNDGATDPTMDIIPEPVSDPTSDSIPDPTTDPIPDPTSDWAPDTTTDPGTGTGVVGDPCASDGDCGGIPSAEAFCLTSVGGYISFPGGYCSSYCTDDGPCGAGAVCVVMYSYGICMQPCTSDTECRTAEGYTCNAIPYVTDAPYCVPPF